MRTTRARVSGSVNGKMLTGIGLLAAVAGLVFLILNRPANESPRTAGPAGLPEVSRTNLVLVDGRLRRTGEDTPFHGFMLEHHADGTLRSRSAISNGVLNGLSQGWFTNQQIQVSEHFKDGTSHGTRTKWYINGATQSVAAIVEGQFHGTFRRWHENGTLAEQVGFVHGAPDGVSLAYFPSGSLKARVLMNDGKTVEQQFWKDGEKIEPTSADSAAQLE